MAYFESITGLPSECFGLTGSLLTSSHNHTFSDIDLLVYGREQAARLKAQLGQGGSAEFRRPSMEQINRWCSRVTEHFPLSFEDAEYLAKRRWNYGYFGPRYVSIHAIRQDNEITEQYGDRFYGDGGSARIRAVLSDVSESMFLPSIYRVEGVEVMEGNPDAAEVRELVTFEGLFSDIAEPGDAVEAFGKLERVNGVPGRVVVGTTGQTKGFVRVLEESGG